MVRRRGELTVALSGVSATCWLGRRRTDKEARPTTAQSYLRTLTDERLGSELHSGLFAWAVPGKRLTGTRYEKNWLPISAACNLVAIECGALREGLTGLLDPFWTRAAW